MLNTSSLVYKAVFWIIQPQFEPKRHHKIWQRVKYKESHWLAVWSDYRYLTARPRESGQAWAKERYKTQDRKTAIGDDGYWWWRNAKQKVGKYMFKKRDHKSQAKDSLCFVLSLTSCWGSHHTTTSVTVAYSLRTHITNLTSNMQDPLSTQTHATAKDTINKYFRFAFANNGNSRCHTKSPMCFNINGLYQ